MLPSALSCAAEVRRFLAFGWSMPCIWYSNSRLKIPSDLNYGVPFVSMRNLGQCPAAVVMVGANSFCGVKTKNFCNLRNRQLPLVGLGLPALLVGLSEPLCAVATHVLSARHSDNHCHNFASVPMQVTVLLTRYWSHTRTCPVQLQRFIKSGAAICSLKLVCLRKSSFLFSYSS